MKFSIRDVTMITQFHNAFFQWLNINQSRFATPAFEIVGGHRVVRLNMPGLHKAFHFVLYSRGVVMSYDWQGIHWTLKTFEALPVATEGVYFDGLCQNEFAAVYPSLEALWAKRVFELFLAWVNRELTPPRWLARDRLVMPLTDVAFIDQPDPNWRIVMPIWVKQDQ